MTTDNKKLFLVKTKYNTIPEAVKRGVDIEDVVELTPSDLEILISAIKFGNQMERNPNKNSALLAKLRSVK